MIVYLISNDSNNQPNLLSVRWWSWDAIKFENMQVYTWEVELQR